MHSPSKPITILLADDDPDDRMLTRDAFEESRLRNVLETVEDGEELMRLSVRYAEAEAPALIFMDVELPGVDGIKTSAMLRQNPKTCNIPIVALTAWMSGLWREKASKAGIKTYLLKPVSSQALKETIEELTNEPLIRAATVTLP